MEAKCKDRCQDPCLEGKINPVYARICKIDEVAFLQKGTVTLWKLVATISCCWKKHKNQSGAYKQEYSLYRW